MGIGKKTVYIGGMVPRKTKMAGSYEILVVVLLCITHQFQKLPYMTDLLDKIIDKLGYTGMYTVHVD